MDKFLKRNVHCDVCHDGTYVVDEDELRVFKYLHEHPKLNEDGDVDVHVPNGADEVGCTHCDEVLAVDMHGLDWGFSDWTGEPVCAPCSVKERDQWQTP